MAGFMDRVERLRAQAKAESEQNFSCRVLGHVAKFFEIDIKKASYSSEFGFVWFHKEYPHFPIRLDARRMEVDLPKLLKDMPRSWAWNVYMQLLEETTAERLAVVIPIVKGGLYVMHNWWMLDCTPGYTRICHKAKTHNRGIIFEPLTAFLEAVKKDGFVP